MLQRPTTARAALLSTLLLFALLLAGCHDPQGGEGDDPVGSMDEEDDGDPVGGTDGTGEGEAVTLAFAERGEKGEILVDGEGRTLYVFTNDDPGVSNCSGDCATNWPPVLASEIAAAPAVISDRVDVVSRDDGTGQAAYDDLPLYLFAGDEEPGDVNGDGRGGVWFVVRHPPANSEMLDVPGDHAVTTTEVQYHPGTMGFLATPNGVSDAPGVVMVHEWWGLNDHLRHMAELLATHGYRVLAVDLFEGNVATDAQGAQSQVANLDQEEATENMQAAAEYLRDAGATSIVSLGWCFGGGQSLQLALSGEELTATVIYYGTPLVTDDDELEDIDWPVLGIFGEDDAVIPVDQVRAFETALDDLSIENEVYIYPDVGHAFANPSGDAWAPGQTVDAWERTLAFLETHAAG